MPADEISDDDVLAAARYRRDAVERVLAHFYPLVCRMSFALTGSFSAGNAAVRAVMSRSLRALGGWAGVAEARNWFLHYTVLVSRWRISAAGDDPLLNRESQAPAYLALVKALRDLPTQQREAFLLSHGEKLQPRQLGIAMDCSQSAAANHLLAATQALSRIAGPGFNDLTAGIVRIYAALTPRQELVVGDISQRVSGFLARRRMWRTAGRVASIIAVAAILWMIRRLCHMIEF